MNSSEWKADIHVMESLSSASDESLVFASQSGSRCAYGELCRRHSRMASRTVLQIVRNEQDTEDVLQDTMMKALLHIASFEGRCSFSTWFTRIAINSALMLLRKRRARVIVSIDDDLEGVMTQHKEIVEPSLNPEASYIDRESQLAIYQNICRLRPQLRSVIELRYSDERLVSEIADEAGISVAAVKSRLMRARKALKGKIRSKAHKSGSGRIDSYKRIQDNRVPQL